ncbi:unnamed protein product [Diamesa tonsa]
MKFLVSVLLIAFGIAVQVNSSEAFLWTFFRPISTATTATVSSSSSNSSSPNADVNGQSDLTTGDLDGSNAILATGKNISTNVVQTFYAPPAETTTTTTTTAAPTT